jgi:dienelactone hydrolase
MMKNLYEVNQRSKPVLVRNRLLLLLSTLSLYLNVFGQTVNVPKTLPASFNNLTGYYEHLPQDYNANPNKKYPLLVFVHGVGELAGANGRTLQPKVLVNGPPRLIERGQFPASFTVKGQQFSFIVITPQFKVWPGSGDVHRLIEYIKTQRRVDDSRIYVTGLSMGGGVTWGALSEDQAKARKIAASVVICGAWGPDKKLADVIAEDNTPVWALHNEGDPTVPSAYSKGWVRDINSHKPAPDPAARLTVFQRAGHDAWTRSYDPNYKEDGLNVYEWMLQYARGTASPPPGTPPTTPGKSKRINVPANSARQIYYPDAMKSLNVQPGDTLCIAAGDYDYIYFNNLQGTADKPIIIQNCGGLVRVGVSSTSSNGAFVLARSKYFKIEGTGTPGLEYGFDVNGTNARGNIMYGFFLGDGCTDYELHNAYVHDCGSFVQAKTIQQCDHPEWLEGSFVMRNVKIYHLKCRNSAWEGFYIGNTHYLFSERGCKDMKSHHVENLEVYDNDLENMGSDAIQISMADLGNNLVHHNRVVNYGTSKIAAHGYGILSGGGSTLRIYNNRVDRGYNCGVQIFGSGINYVYNNVVSNIETEGINVTDKLQFQPATGYIYNNTIFNTDVNAVKIYADLTTVGHKVYNNLVIAKGSRYDYPQSGFYIRGSRPIKFDAAGNLSYQNISDAYFQDAGSGNVHLTGKSGAVNEGRDMQDLNLTLDMDNHSRPYNGKYDVGAYEYTGTTSPNVAPAADAGKDQMFTLPISLVVQLDGSSSKDSDGTIKSYSWKKKSGPALGTIVTPNAAKTTLAALIAGVYVFELTVTDDKGATSTDEVNVTVNAAANKPPVADAGNDITITQPASSVTLNGSESDDPDGNLSHYDWKKVSGPSGETIVTPNSSKTNVTGLRPGSYVFELTVKDDKGSSSADRVNVTVYPRNNDIPVARAGTDKTITLPLNTVELNGVTSSDPDGRITQYAWQKISGPAGGYLTAAFAAKTNITNLTVGVYEFQLTVTDNDNATASDRVTVTVLEANKPPKADAGSDITITLPASSAQLNGSSSSDPDGSIADYTWKKISGPAGGVIANADVAKTTVSSLAAGTYVFELTVTDDDNSTASDRVTITVIQPAANKPPLAKAGIDKTITLPLNTVELNGITSSDPDGRIIDYAWQKISGPAGGYLTAAFAAKSNITNLTAGVYEYQLTVTDNDNATASDRVTVTVLKANEPPKADAGSDITITLPAGSAQLNGGGSSDADGSIADYTWKKISGPAGGVIANADVASTTVSSLAAGTYVFELTVTDDDNSTASDRVTITVIQPAANKPPLAKAGADITITLPVNSAHLNGSASSDPDGSISGYSWKKISGPAGGAIASSNGKETDITSLAAGTYTFELTVTDNDNATASDRVLIVVHPAPNKAPVARAGNDISITLPLSSVQLDGRGSSDADGTIARYAWKKASGPAGGAISSPAAGATQVTGLQAGTYVFELTVTDDDGATASDRITVAVSKTPNKKPAASAGSDKNITLPVNSVQLDGSASSDPDGSISSYSWIKISGPAGGAIASSGSKITNITGLLAGSYEYQLTVTDNEGATASDRVLVTVNPEPRRNKAPVAVTSADEKIQLPADKVYINGRASHDPDGRITAYAWKQVSGPSTAVIAHADWTETLVSGLKAGAYTFELTVTDNEGARASDRVTITVSAAPGNQVPIAVTQGNQVVQYPSAFVFASGKASHDPDGSITAYRWKQLSGPSASGIETPDRVETRISGLKPGKYEFQLTVTDNKHALNSATFTVDVLADKILRPTDLVAMWPNPAVNFIRTSVRYMGAGDKLYFSVYDMTGRSHAVFTHPLTDRTLQKDLDISNLPAGYYTLEIKDEKNEFRWTGKFLKAGN